jgi:hypothetical protein
VVGNAKLLVDTNFNIPGSTIAGYVIERSPSGSNLDIINEGSLRYLHSEVTHCSSDSGASVSCHRAELKSPTGRRRERVFGDSEGEYWMGWRSRISPGASAPNVQMQVHGGDNLGRSPVLSLKSRGEQMEIMSCGSTVYRSNRTQITCSRRLVGPVSSGQWEDWVIHFKWSHTANNLGFIEVWRNGALVIYQGGIINSFWDINAHYLKFGTYIYNWKTFVDFPSNHTNSIGTDFLGMRVGDKDSNYAEVFIGSTTPGPTVVPTISRSTADPSSTQSPKVSPTAEPLLGYGRLLLLLLLLLFLFYLRPRVAKTKTQLHRCGKRLFLRR